MAWILILLICHSLSLFAHMYIVRLRILKSGPSWCLNYLYFLRRWTFFFHEVDIFVFCVQRWFRSYELCWAFLSWVLLSVSCFGPWNGILSEILKVVCFFKWKNETVIVFIIKVLYFLVDRVNLSTKWVFHFVSTSFLKNSLFSSHFLSSF